MCFSLKNIDVLSCRNCSTPVEENHNELHKCPSLTDMGLLEDKEPTVWKGGEIVALERYSVLSGRYRTSEGTLRMSNHQTNIKKTKLFWFHTFRWPQ